MRRAIALLAAVVALTAMACSAEDGQPKEAVSLMVAGDPVETQAFRDVVAAYEDANPGAKVNLIEIADRDEMIAKLATAYAGGEPPDLFVLNYRYFGQFAAKGFLQELGGRQGGSDAIPADAFYTTALDAFKWDGEQMCLPMNASSLVVYWNRDIFEKAGVRPPRAGWSWHDMARSAEELTADRDGDGEAERYGMAVDPDLLRVAPFVWSNGGALVNDPANPTSLALDTPEAVRALREFLALRIPRGVTPTDREAEAVDPEARFLAGDVAMIMESRKAVPSFRTITDFSWDVAPLPVFEQPAGVLHSDGYCMSARATDPSAAWRFLEFALGPEGQRVAAATGRTVPSLIQVAESDAFLDPALPPESAQVFLDNVPVARPVPVLANWPEIEDTANGLIEEGYYTGAEAEEVATETVFQTEPLFAEE